MPDLEALHGNLDGDQHDVTSISTAGGEERDLSELSEKTRQRVQRGVQTFVVIWASPSCEVRTRGRRAFARARSGGAK